MDIGALTASLPTLILAVVAVIVLWLLLSWLLRLAWKIISCGCVVILAFALILLGVYFLGR